MAKVKQKVRIIVATKHARRERSCNTAMSRFMRIFAVLNKRGHLRTKDMADELEIDERTMQRDVRALRDSEFIIEDPLCRGKWIFNSAEHSWNKLDVTDHDAATLAFLYKFSKVFGGQISKSVLNAIDKMFVLDDTEHPFFMITPRVKQPDTELPFYKDLYEAIQQKNKINLTYKSAEVSKTAKVWPCKFILCEGMWYLGYLLEPQGKGRQEIRTLRYSHIVKAERLDETFEKPAWVKETLKAARNIWFNHDETIKVVMEASNRVKDYFELNEYFPCQKIVNTGKDSFTVEARINHPNEVVPTLLRFLPEIRVIEPKSIKDEVVRRIRAYQDQL